MALNFPSSPANGQTYVSGGVTWTYSATTGAWEVTQSGSIEAHTHTLAQITDAKTGAGVNIHVGTSPPGSPGVGDLWIDTN